MSKKMKVSIIIPFYDKWTITHRRMMELQTYLTDPVEIVLVDDCSKNNYVPQMLWWVKNGKHSVETVYNFENLGFGGSHNIGVQYATGDVLILLSNDVQVMGDFVSAIVRKLKLNKRALVGNTLYDFSTGWNVRKINGEHRLFPYLGGYLLACTREIWDELGGFDPIYEKFDAEDLDLSTTAIYKGIDLVPLNCRMIRHFSGQTIRGLYPDRERYTIKNLKRFDEKWSKILKGG